MSNMEPFDVVVRNRVVFAVQQREPIAWIEKLIDLNANCIGNAFPPILEIRPQPSFEVIQLLADNCPPDSVPPSVLPMIIKFDPPPSFELVQNLVEKSSPGSVPPSVLPLILEFNPPPSFELIQQLVEKCSPEEVLSALPSILKLDPPPSFEIFQLLVKNCSPKSVPSVSLSILMSKEQPSFEVVQLLVEKCPSDSVPSVLSSVLKSNQPPSFKIIQCLVEKCPIPMVTTVLSSIIDFDSPPSFEVIHLLAEKCPPDSMPSSVFLSILKFKIPPSFELIQLLVEKFPTTLVYNSSTSSVYNASTGSVYSVLSSLLKSEEPPSFKVIRLLLEKYSAAVKQQPYQDYQFGGFYLLHDSCNCNPDFEIIQCLVNLFPFACLKLDDSNQTYLLPLEIVKRKTADKRIIDFLTKATQDMACVFVESVFACKHKKIFELFENYQHSSNMYYCLYFGEKFCLDAKIIRADGSLDFERLLSQMHAEEIGKMMRCGRMMRRGPDSADFPSRLLQSSDFLNLMEQINEINKAKREFDERTAVPFPEEPKTIISSK